jgi:hypothetical protein
MPFNVKAALDEIDEVLTEFDEFRKASESPDYYDTSVEKAIMITNRMASTIDRLAPPGSLHKRQLGETLARKVNAWGNLKRLHGGLLALRREYELGRLQSVAELVHADTFASFMEMAEHLHGQGYKDAATVVAGSVLEQHLRELCNKNGIAVQDGNGKYKRAELLNTELAGQDVYSKLDQKNVTSWLGLRNEAAHGNYTNYTAQQVSLMISAVQDFMIRHPA